jgi:hypothetical protein
MPKSKKELSEAEYNTLCGYDDGKQIDLPHHPDQMDDSLRQRPDGSFYLHRLTFDDMGGITGCIKLDVSAEQAAAWWSDNFIPPVLRPHLPKQ